MPFPLTASNDSPVGAPLRIALCSSECAPFAKTGGLADVSAALAKELWRRGHDVRLFVPYYRRIDESGIDTTSVTEPFHLEFPDRRVGVEIRQGVLEGALSPDGKPLMVNFVNAPDAFDRADLYTDDDDEPLRWTIFCRSILESFLRFDWAPDIVHANDWHTGLLPLMVRREAHRSDEIRGTRTVLSIHNLGYQGVFPADSLPSIGMENVRELFHQERLNKEGIVNFLETGILHADWLSTVSKTYADEIQTSDHGMGLDGLLARRDDHLMGIVNGVDYGEWSPDVDPHIPAHFNPTDMAGKRVCRDALLDEMGLAPDPRGPVLGIVSRMTGQKGFELLPDILPVLLQANDMRLCILGSGEERYERYFQWLRDSMPTKVGVYFGYKNELSHRIEAGSDMFLMPSRYEPCGLNQMYSLRYGTVPLVRATGGLADTVERYDASAGTGTGFCFYDFTSAALHDTLRHAFDVFADQPAWKALQARGMAIDHSWSARVREYEHLYSAALTEIPSLR